MSESPEEPEAFPREQEEAQAAQTKLAADLSRLPVGTQVRLSLTSGDALTGAKGAYGSRGIRIDGYGYTPFSELAGFEQVADHDEAAE